MGPPDRQGRLRLRRFMDPITEDMMDVTNSIKDDVPNRAKFKINICPGDLQGTVKRQ